MSHYVRTVGQGAEVIGVVREKGRQPYAEMTEQAAQASASERNARAEAMGIKTRYEAAEYVAA